MKKGYIDIKNGSGDVIISLPIPETATLQCELQGDSFISLSFEWNVLVTIDYGSYIEYDGLQYKVYEKYTPTSSFGRYKYDVNFYDKSYCFRDIMMLFIPTSSESSGAGEVRWSFFGTVGDFATIVKRNIKRSLNEDIEIRINERVKKTGHTSISFDGNNIKEALDKIADTFKTIWIFDSRRNILFFGIDDLQKTYSIRHNEVSVFDNNRGESIHRLFAFGGTKNIPALYRGSLAYPIEHVSGKRLMLPLTKKYIEDENVTNRKEGTVVFDDIFPRVESTVREIRKRVAKRKIEEGSGKVSFSDINLFQISDKNLKIHTGLLLDGEKLKVKFLSGYLSGLEFEAVCPIGYKPNPIAHIISEKIDGLLASSISEDKKAVFVNAKKVALKRGEVNKIQEVSVAINGVANEVADRDLSLKIKETSILFSVLSEFSKRELSTYKFVKKGSLPEGYVEIQPNDNYGEFLPNEKMCPQKGDLYVVTGYDPKFVWEEAVSEAENELKNRAEEWLRENNSNQFPVILDSIETHGFGFQAKLGDGILYLSESGESVQGDVIKYEQNICNPQKQKITIGRYARPSILETLGRRSINTSHSNDRIRDDLSMVSGTNLFSGLHNVGEEVLFEGEVYRSLTDNNTSIPSKSDSWVKVVPSNLDEIVAIREAFDFKLNSTVDSVFTARKSELKGRDGAGVHENLLKGYRGVKKILVEKDTAYNFYRLFNKELVESGKNYLVVADYTCTSEKKPEFVNLIDYWIDGRRKSRTRYTGNPTRVALFIKAEERPSDILGVLGYSGEAGKCNNIGSEYSNIMLLEWGDSWDGVIPPYFPHVDDLKVTADEVSASLIASGDFKANLSVSTAKLLNNNTEFKKAVKGEKGEQGVNGIDGTSVTIADLKANASFMQHTAREVAKFGEFATTEQLSKELLHLKREFREVERESDNPYTVILEDPELHNEGKVVEVGFKESLSCVYDDGRILHSGDVYSSEMQILPKKNGYILPPNENSCYHNHFVFKVVRYENKKVWQWENYELLKVSKTVQAVAGHSLSIQSVEQDVGLLKGQVRNLQSKEIDINNQLLEQGGNINTLFQKHSRTETEVEALKAGEHRITIKSLRNASIVSAPLNTLQMTHETTANSLYLPSPSEGLSFRLWANHWVNKTITIRKPSFPSNNFLINTATNTQISSLTLIAGHLYDFVAVSYNTWIVTDLSR